MGIPDENVNKVLDIIKGLDAHPRTCDYALDGYSRKDHDDPNSVRHYKLFIVKNAIVQMYGVNWFRIKTLDNSKVVKSMKQLEKELKKL